MVKSKPKKIQGRWYDGFTLDVQTVRSTFRGYDEYGHKQFDNERSEIGELLYRLKYHSDTTVVDDLVKTAVNFIRNWRIEIDSIIPVPPSRHRTIQPVLLMAQGVTEKLDLEFIKDAVEKTKDVPQLKDVWDYNERAGLLEGIFSVDKEQIKGRSILLFDDLYRSGATMNEITKTLYDGGGARKVFAFTITRTRSNT